MHKEKPKIRCLRIALASICILILWQLIAMTLQNDILIPYPSAVVQTMWTQLLDASFYDVILHTLFRTLCGFFIALSLALIMSLLSYFYTWIEDMFYPILLLTRSIPNISYILIVLFWFSSESSVIIISFLILFPTIYVNLRQGLSSMSTTLQDVLQVYPAPRWYAIQKMYLPHLTPYLFASMSAGISLSFKVGIMAEVLGQVKIGIGRQLNICRLNLDMAGVFAWTIWIILLLFIMEKLLAQLQKKAMS